MKRPPPPAGEDTHPPDLILTAFRRHFGDQLDVSRCAGISRRPSVRHEWRRRRVIDLDRPHTWPEATRRWAEQHAARLAGSTEFLADLAIPLELEDEFRQTFGPRNVLAYHCTRLLSHEADAISTDGLRLLDKQLVEDRIADAVAHNALLHDARRRAQTGNVYAIDNSQGRAGQVCFVIGRAAFDEHAGGCDPLLRYWGGEAIRGSPAAVPELAKVGSPSIVVARPNLDAPSQRPVFVAGARQALRGLASGARRPLRERCITATR